MYIILENSESEIMAEGKDIFLPQGTDVLNIKGVAYSISHRFIDYDKNICVVNIEELL